MEYIINSCGTLIILLKNPFVKQLRQNRRNFLFFPLTHDIIIWGDNMAKNEKWQSADEFDRALDSFEGSGRKFNQRLKPLFVLRYLQNNSDDETFVSVDDIIKALNDLGIAAERRSIYKDIKEINVAH